MERQRYFIDHADGKWCIFPEGADKPVGAFPTKKQAIDRGRELAKRRGNSQLVVKKMNHVIQTEWTYGHDPERHPG
jgi:Uncharacterized protein conserved in bacteria (DUF2188)